MPSISLSGIQVVVFDLDDTLYPEREFAFSGFSAVADWLRTRVECKFDAAVRMQDLYETEHRGHVFDHLLSELGYDQEKEMVRAMIDCYHTHVPRIALFDDADRALARWSGIFRLALISDGLLDVQQRKIDALGLERRLERIILTDQWGLAFWKPHLRAFLEIERTWSSRPSACIYIADNGKKDFIAPRQRGWQTIQVRRPEGVYRDLVPPAGGEPHLQVDSLDEIELTSLPDVS